MNLDVDLIKAAHLRKVYLMTNLAVLMSLGDNE